MDEAIRLCNLKLLRRAILKGNEDKEAEETPPEDFVPHLVTSSPLHVLVRQEVDTTAMRALLDTAKFLRIDEEAVHAHSDWDDCGRFCGHYTALSFLCENFHGSGVAPPERSESASTKWSLS